MTSGWLYAGCVQPLPANSPERVGDYALLGKLGAGAMGSVYLGRSRGGRPVAVKVARAELAESPEFRERFRREVAMARSVGGFWTATVVGADPDAPRPWMATEYVVGPTLQQAVQAHGPLPELSVRRLAAGLAEALVAIHGAGLVHRDLKPSNVLLAADGPRVIDFGIARALEHSALTEAGMVFGTPGFLSPEQVVGNRIGPQSDVFALGAVLVYAATGHGPFGEGATSALVYRVVHQDPDLSRVPPGLVPLIVPCLVRDPAHRPSPARLLETIEVPHLDSTWLPAPVRTLVEQRHTELQSLPAMAAAVAVKPPTRVMVEESPKPKLLEKKPKDQRPAGVRFKTSRVSSVVWAGGYGTGSAVMATIADANSAAPSGVKLGALIAFLGLAVIAVRYLIGALTASLTLDVGPSGLVLTSGNEERRLPWYAIARCKVVAHRRRPWLVVWLMGAAGEPEPLKRGSFRPYKGGFRMYPISHEKSQQRRDQDVVELRAALAWYASASYDPR